MIAGERWYFHILPIIAITKFTALNVIMKKAGIRAITLHAVCVILPLLTRIILKSIKNYFLIKRHASSVIIWSFLKPALSTPTIRVMQMIVQIVIMNLILSLNPGPAYPVTQLTGVTIPKLQDATHDCCKNCHEDIFDKGFNGCSDCHAKKDMKKHEGTYSPCLKCHQGKKIKQLMPARMNAFHKQCLSCHQELKKGPFGENSCNKCHFK
jgi:hypothetical protein